ncbi:MAG: aryl-sulfate sulfotransferase [Ekhidna sp.]|nr:aryl-sulfate sulfotransferase [Ekhidna sp.]
MQKSKLPQITFYLLIILLGSCNNDDFSDEVNALKEDIETIQNVNDLLVLKNLLLKAKLNEDPIVSINDQGGIITGFELENQGQITIKNDLITDFEVSSGGWYTSLLFNDLTTFKMPYLGDETGVDIVIDRDISNNAPLTAVATVTTPISGSVEIRVIGRDGKFSDMITNSTAFSNKHEIEILGLYGDFKNSVEFKILSPHDKERLTIIRNITTDPLPDGLPKFKVVKQYKTEEQNVVFLVNFRPTNIPFMVDRFGKIRWYLTGFGAEANVGLQRLKNGNIGFGKRGDGQGSVYELTKTGQLLREYSFYPDFENAHHDVYEMSNGNFIIPVNKVGAATIEDYIIEMDRNSQRITNIWDLNLILPKRDALINDPADWVHVNAVIHDERDNSIIISGQRQGVFKVTWDNELKWIFAPPFDWAGYEDYLLTSTNPNMEWIWGQHAPLITPEGNILLFDNGLGRGFGTSEKFSRALEVQITENDTGGTVKTVWEYGRERGEAFFSPIVSDVDYITESDTRLIVSGSLAFSLNYTDKDNISFSWSTDFLKASIIEMDEDKNILFELNINSEITASHVYRAEKLKLN